LGIKKKFNKLVLFLNKCDDGNPKQQQPFFSIQIL
jgi:hypothetical protein